MKYDFVVVGAGVSGMASAVLLAQNGLNVALVEKAPQIAPLVRGFKRKGIWFDTGFHYAGGLGEGELLNTLFHYLQLSGLEKIPFDTNGFDLLRCLDEGFEFPFPYGYDRIKDRLLQTFPYEQHAIETFLADTQNAYNSIPFVRLKKVNFFDYFTNSTRGPTLLEYVKRLTRNEKLRWVLSIHCSLHGVPPEEVSFSYHAAVFGSFLQSVHGLKGGGLSLVKSFQSRLKALGVDVICGQSVTKIEFSGSLLSAVRLADGRELTCKGCISSIHPQQLLKIAPDWIFRTAYRNRLRQLDETPSAFIYFGKCNAIPSVLEHRNILATTDYNLTAFRLDEPLSQRPIFLTCNRPSGQEQTKMGLMAIVSCTMDEVGQWRGTVLGKRPTDYSDFKERAGDLISQRIRESCPELKGEIEFLELSTPLTIRDYGGTPFGSLYGVKHKVGQHSVPPITKAKGVYLVGQATLAPGILGTIISAVVVCGFIIGQEKIFKDIGKCL